MLTTLPPLPTPRDTRSVDENTAADTNIGAPITADDPDTTTLTYTLEGTDAASFDIDSASGQLKTNPHSTTRPSPPTPSR